MKRNPQVSSSTLAALETLQPEAFGFLQTVEFPWSWYLSHKIDCCAWGSLHLPINQIKVTPELMKEEVATQVDEKVKEEVATQVVVDEQGKEAAQTTEEMQRDEGEFADKEEMDEEESEWMHVYS